MQGATSLLTTVLVSTMVLVATAVQAEAFSLIEVPALTTEMIEQSFGLSWGDSFRYDSFSGYGPAYGFRMQMSGACSGLPVSLTFEGDQTSFTATGMIGSHAWNGSGFWNEFQSGLNTFETDLYLAATISGTTGPAGKPAGHSHIIEDESGGGTVPAFHDVSISLDGVDVYHDTGWGYVAGHYLPLPPPPQYFQERWSSRHLTVNGTLVFGTYGDSSMEYGGVITVVPEPSTWLLFGTGFAVLSWLGRKKRGHYS